MMALFFSWVGNVLIMSPEFTMILAGVICSWGMLLLYSYHMLKKISGPLADQFKKNMPRSLPLFVYYTWFLWIGILHKNLGKLVPAISFYAITLTGTGFLSTLLCLDQKEKTTFAFMSGVIFITISGTLLTVKLFVVNNLLIETLIRLLYIVAQFLICFYFEKSINTL